MRKIPLLVAALLLAACETPIPWQKAGVERSVLEGDVLICRHTGMQESLRATASMINFPFHSAPFWSAWPPVREQFVRSVEADRARAATRFAGDCMQGKGYERTSPPKVQT